MKKLKEMIQRAVRELRQKDEPKNGFNPDPFQLAHNQSATYMDQYVAPETETEYFNRIYNPRYRYHSAAAVVYTTTYAIFNGQDTAFRGLYFGTTIYDQTDEPGRYVGYRVVTPEEKGPCLMSKCL